MAFSHLIHFFPSQNGEFPLDSCFWLDGIFKQRLLYGMILHYVSFVALISDQRCVEYISTQEIKQIGSSIDETTMTLMREIFQEVGQYIVDEKASLVVTIYMTLRWFQFPSTR